MCATAVCRACGRRVPVDELHAALQGGEAALARLNAKYGGLVKPDIVRRRAAQSPAPRPACATDAASVPFVPLFSPLFTPQVFFGEALPERFGRLAPVDFGECDLLIVMGTSLQA